MAIQSKHAKIVLTGYSTTKINKAIDIIMKNLSRFNITIIATFSCCFITLRGSSGLCFILDVYKIIYLITLA